MKQESPSFRAGSGQKKANLQLLGATEFHRATFVENPGLELLHVEVKDLSVFDPDPKIQVFQYLSMIRWILRERVDTHTEGYPELAPDVLLDLTHAVEIQINQEKVLKNQLQGEIFDVRIALQWTGQEWLWQVGTVIDREGEMDFIAFDFVALDSENEVSAPAQH